MFKSPKQKKKHKQHHEEEDTAAQEKIKALEAELAAQKKIASNAINVAKNSTEGLTSKASASSAMNLQKHFYSRESQRLLRLPLLAKSRERLLQILTRRLENIRQWSSKVTMTSPLPTDNSVFSWIMYFSITLYL